jgi:hypothetical protein
MTRPDVRARSHVWEAPLGLGRRKEHDLRPKIISPHMHKIIKHNRQGSSYHMSLFGSKFRLLDHLPVEYSSAIQHTHGSRTLWLCSGYTSQFCSLLLFGFPFIGRLLDKSEPGRIMGHHGPVFAGMIIFFLKGDMKMVTCQHHMSASHAPGPAFFTLNPKILVLVFRSKEEKLPSYVQAIVAMKWWRTYEPPLPQTTAAASKPPQSLTSTWPLEPLPTSSSLVTTQLELHGQRRSKSATKILTRCTPGWVSTILIKVTTKFFSIEKIIDKFPNKWRRNTCMEFWLNSKVASASTRIVNTLKSQNILRIKKLLPLVSFNWLEFSIILY